MKLIHTGDLHIGKTVNNFNMLQDQKAVLHEMVELARVHNVQAFVIAGDVYDRALPTAEAVTVMNDFLDELRMLNIPIFIISGNHDSPQRLEFAEKILEKQSVYIAGTFKEKLKQITLEDEYGDIIFTMMPFVKPALLSVTTSKDAVAAMLETVEQSQNIRNILITHYFVTSEGKEPELSDSETGAFVGGLDSVDTGLFKDFDYVALGHIHKPQRMKKDNPPVNYAGAPIAYSFSECEQEKSVALVDIKEKGNIEMTRLPLHPLHGMRKIKGKLEQLIEPSTTRLADTEDYLQVTLTNEEELIDPINTLRNVYPNIMQLLFEKNEMSSIRENKIMEDIENKTTNELFADFYRSIREKDMDEERKQIINEILEEMEF